MFGQKQKSKNKLHEENTFPYLNSGGPAPSINGSLGDSSNGPNTSVPVPQGIQVDPLNRGVIIPSGISNTDYIDTNTVQHGVLAGNS